MGLQLRIFWIINLFREDIQKLLISTLVTTDRENLILFGVLLIACLVLAFVKYGKIPKDQRTVWSLILDVEKTRESKKYKLLSISCVLMTSALTLHEWQKEDLKGYLVVLQAGVSILINFWQIISIFTYDGPYRDDLYGSLKLARIKLPGWIGPIRNFWCDSGSLLGDLQFLSLIYDPKKSIQELRCIYSHLPWETIEDLNKEEINVLASETLQYKDNKTAKVQIERLKSRIDLYEAQEKKNDDQPRNNLKEVVEQALKDKRFIMTVPAKSTEKVPLSLFDEVEEEFLIGQRSIMTVQAKSAEQGFFSYFEEEFEFETNAKSR